MSDYGFKVSRTGDVKTASILDQTLNSEKNSLKIALTGTTSSTANGARTIDIAHDLDVIPMYFVWYEVSDNGKWYCNFSREDFSGKEAYCDAYTDSEHLHLDIYTNINAKVEVSYIIFVDPGGS